MLKLLIADDEKTLRETIHSFIDWKALGIEVIGTAKNGIEAYHMILDQYPDIVLTDIKMPGLSGLELIQKIHELNHDTMFIILSGYHEFEYAKKAMKYGVRHYLLKPCSEQQIIDSISEIQAEYQHKITQKNMLAEHDALKKIQLCIHQVFSANPEDEQPLNALLNIIENLQQFSFLQQIAPSLIMTAFTSVASFGITDAVDFLNTLNKESDLLLYKEKLISKIRFLYAHKSTVSSTGEISDHIKKYVTEHLANPNLSLKWIAENELYMNVDYISKKFVKETGQKFSAYLTEMRVKKAKELLSVPNPAPIADIAEFVGCGNNPMYFSQIFKKITGMSPSSYSKQYFSTEHE